MANTVLAPTVSSVTVRVSAMAVSVGSVASTTYYYLTSLGVAGSTTDRAAIPSGATVLRVSSS